MKKSSALRQCKALGNMAQINLQGQITIPPELQEQLDLKPGTEIQLEVVDGTLQVRRAEEVQPSTFNAVADLIGAIDSSTETGVAPQNDTYGDLLNAKFAKQGLTNPHAGVLM